jgi:hypothetical protein
MDEIKLNNRVTVARINVHMALVCSLCYQLGSSTSWSKLANGRQPPNGRGCMSACTFFFVAVAGGREAPSICMQSKSHAARRWSRAGASGYVYAPASELLVSERDREEAR